MVEENKIQTELKRKRVETAAEHNKLLLTNIEDLQVAENRDSKVQTKVIAEKKSVVARRLNPWTARYPA